MKNKQFGKIKKNKLIIGDNGRLVIAKKRKRSKVNSNVVYSKKNTNYSKEYGVDFRKNNFAKYLLNNCKSSAKKRGMDFDLNISDIRIPEYCPYLNIRLTRDVGKGRIETNPSIDRIDNSKGYVRGNIRIISLKANIMKNNASITDLIVFASNILKIHG